MMTKEIKELWGRVRQIQEEDFEDVALEIFRLQAKENKVYGEFIRQLQIDPDLVSTVEAIPFLPIEVFKRRQVQTGSWKPEEIFQSSGTTGQTRSRHLIRSLETYHDLAMRTFESQICLLRELPILALLPHYLEQGQSSLVNMVAAFIRRSGHRLSRFFLYDREGLTKALEECVSSERPFLLMGVSYAVLDLAMSRPIALGKHAIVMETGGMKGRKPELSREELHDAIKSGFAIDSVFSEYGMTELLSQAYSRGGGLFRPAAQMQVLIKEFNDPWSEAPHQKPGVIHVIDLANLDTCSFIATSDMGCTSPDGSFKVLGRLENSDRRGCNLLYTEITD